MGFTKLRPQEAQPDITEPEAVVNLAVQTGNLQACSSGTEKILHVHFGPYI